MYKTTLEVEEFSELYSMSVGGFGQQVIHVFWNKIKIVTPDKRSILNRNNLLLWQDSLKRNIKTNLPTGSSNSFLMRHARRLQLNAMIKKVAIIVQISRNSLPELSTLLISENSNEGLTYKFSLGFRHSGEPISTIERQPKHSCFVRLVNRNH